MSRRLLELRAVLANTGRALSVLWTVSPTRTGAFAAVAIVDALLPAAMAYVAKRIIDSLMAGAGGETLTWVGVEAGLAIVRSVLYHLDSFWQTYLGSRLGMHVNEMILAKALNLSLSHFEDSAFTDRLSRATKEAGSRPLHLVMHGLRFIQEAVRLGSYIVLLWQFSGWVVLAIALGTTPQFVAQTWAASESFRVQMARTFDERRADYLKEILSRESFVKEVKLFTLGRHLLQRFAGYQSAFFSQDQHVARRTLAVTFAARLLATAVFYGCYVAVVLSALAGRITIGDLTMLMMVVRGSQQSFEAVLTNAAKVYESNLYMENLFSYLGLQEDEPFEELPSVAPDEVRQPPPEIVCDRVCFTYKESERPVLQEVSLTIHPGQTLALVGPNGAGKTTLIKLLCRLYPLTGGRILLQGRPLDELSPGEVRRRIGVIFQDFVQFNLTAGENIGVGWVPAMDDAGQIRAAARGAGAEGFIAALPDGYDTMLGRYYGGAQLSVGQWQRLALARAMMRHSQILILDEPTAAMDAQNEAALFERLEKLKEGRTAILITHRFSTVRFADWIVVLDAGRVVEQGTHEALLARQGLYARMFTIQARGYQLKGESPQR